MRKDETREVQIDRKKGLPHVVCPRCGKSWHGWAIQPQKIFQCGEGDVGSGCGQLIKPV